MALLHFGSSYVISSWAVAALGRLKLSRRALNQVSVQKDNEDLAIAWLWNHGHQCYVYQYLASRSWKLAQGARFIPLLGVRFNCARVRRALTFTNCNSPHDGNLCHLDPEMPFTQIQLHTLKHLISNSNTLPSVARFELIEFALAFPWVTSILYHLFTNNSIFKYLTFASFFTS